MSKESIPGQLTAVRAFFAGLDPAYYGQLIPDMVGIIDFRLRKPTPPQWLERYHDIVANLNFWYTRIKSRAERYAPAAERQAREKLRADNIKETDKSVLREMQAVPGYADLVEVYEVIDGLRNALDRDDIWVQQSKNWRESA